MSSVSAVLLRVLLSLALILNGMGAAVASVQTAGSMMAAASHGMRAVASESGDSACPEHRAATARHDADPSALHPSPSKDGGGHPSPDCCKSSSCHCVGVHACASVPVALTQAPSIAAHALRIASKAQERPSPMLPHLIRPPIG